MAKTNILKKSLNYFTSKIILNPKWGMLLLAYTILGMSFIFIRMKRVELDFNINEVSEKMDDVAADNKDLLARKARLLSVKNLRKLAKNFDLKEPDQNQILVIPSRK